MALALPSSARLFVGANDRKEIRRKAFRRYATGFVGTKAELDELVHGGEPVVVDWMAAWCRKCIYLKPKLEKMCQRRGISIAFVDVNSVSSALVRENAIQKMPTVQVWNRGCLVGSIVGGGEANDVIAQVEKMIDDSMKIEEKSP